MPDAVDRAGATLAGGPKQRGVDRVVHEVDDDLWRAERSRTGTGRPSPPIPTERRVDQSGGLPRRRRALPTAQRPGRRAPPRPRPSSASGSRRRPRHPARPSAAITLRAAPPAPSTTQRSPRDADAARQRRARQKPSPSVLCPTSVPSRFTMQFTAPSGCGLGRELVDELHTPRPCAAWSPTAPPIPMARTPSSASARVARRDVEGDVHPVEPRGLERRVEHDRRERVARSGHRSPPATRVEPVGAATRQRTPFCSAILMFFSCSLQRRRRRRGCRPCRRRRSRATGRLRGSSPP